MATWAQHGAVDRTSRDLKMVAMFALRRHVGCWLHIAMLGLLTMLSQRCPVRCSANVVMLGTGYHVWSTSPCWAHFAMLGPRCHGWSL